MEGVPRRQEIEQMKRQLAYELQEARDLSHLVKQEQAGALREQKRRQEEYLLQLKKEYHDQFQTSGPDLSQTSSKHPSEKSSRRSRPTHRSFSGADGISSTASFNRPFASQFTQMKTHLKKVLELHHKAKELIMKEKSPGPPKKTKSHEHPLNPAALRSLSEEPVPLRMPVYIRESEYRKAQNLPPQMVYRTTRTGEVFPLHLVGNPTPAYDPLIKVETTIYPKVHFPSKRQAAADSLVANAYTRNQDSEESMQFYGRHKSTDERSPSVTTTEPNPRLLTKAPPQAEPTATIPMGRGYSFTFRDLPRDTSSPHKPARKWVNQRMRVYMNERVNKDFRPRPSGDKQLELALRNYRLEKPKSMERVHLHNIK